MEYNSTTTVLPSHRGGRLQHFLFAWQFLLRLVFVQWCRGAIHVHREVVFRWNSLHIHNHEFQWIEMLPTLLLCSWNQKDSKVISNEIYPYHIVVLSLSASKLHRVKAGFRSLKVALSFKILPAKRDQVIYFYYSSKKWKSKKNIVEKNNEWIQEIYIN